MKKELKEKQSPTTEKGFKFTKPENVVMFDNDITSTAKVVYCAIMKHMNSKTRKCNLYVKTIAQEVSRSVRTVQRSLTQLINKNLIIRTERYGADGRNLASCFTVTGPSSGFYSPDAEIRVSKPAHETRASKNDPSDASETETTAEKGVVDMSPTGGTSGGLINYTKDNYITLKGEDTLPSSGENSQEIKQDPEQEKEDPDVPTLKHVPEIMRTTARYLLLRTGRKCLEWYEIPLLQFLASCHKPGRVQKEIDKACEIFIKKGRKLITLSFRYIAACLKKQKTFTPWEKSEKAVKENPAAHLKAYDDWFAEYGDLITGGAKATEETSFAEYDRLIMGGATA